MRVEGLLGFDAEKFGTLNSEFKAVFDTGFLKDVHEVNFDGAGGDLEQAGDFLVFHTAADGTDDFALARGEAVGALAVQEADDMV